MLIGGDRVDGGGGGGGSRWRDRQYVVAIVHVIATQWAVRYQPYSQNVLLLAAMQLTAIHAVNYFMIGKLEHHVQFAPPTQLGLGFLYAIELVLSCFSIALNPVWRHVLILVLVDIVIRGGEYVSMAVAVLGAIMLVYWTRYVLSMGLMVVFGVVCMREVRSAVVSRLAKEHSMSIYELQLNQSPIILGAVFVLAFVFRNGDVSNILDSHIAAFVSSLCVAALALRDMDEARLLGMLN